MFKKIAATHQPSRIENQEERAQKKSLIAKTIQVSLSIFMSRMLGLVREYLSTQYLGVGAMSDAFFTAYKIPNSLRKIFAEGALSAATIPTFVSVLKKDSIHAISSLMTLSFLVFEGALLSICAAIYIYAEWVMRLIAPGWFLTAPDAVMIKSSIPYIGYFLELFFKAWYIVSTPSLQALQAISYLKILISFIIFLSSSALLAGALQAVNHFFIPAFSSVLLNVVYISGLLAGLAFGLPVEWLCFAIIFGGFLQFILHLIVYFKFGFRFSAIGKETLSQFKAILAKFLPCLLSMSILEINLFVSTSIATYLPQGSISLLNYSNRFMGIPLGMLIGAFSTILLPYFSRISIYAPKRLSIYLFEAAKIVFWVTIPCSIIMSFLSEKIFYTIFHSSKFTLEHVQEASQLLSIFLIGLFFFSLYKVLLNIFYALHDTKTPAYVSIFVLFTNYSLCKTLAPIYGVRGLAMAFVITSMIHVSIFALLLYKKFNFSLYCKHFAVFALKALAQTICIFALFLGLYRAGEWLIQHSFNAAVIKFLLFSVGFWFWVMPLCCLTAFILLKTRKMFALRLYFLD